MQKGYKHTDETREKMRVASFTRNNNPRIKALPKTTEHWRWQGNPTKTALHKRLYRWKGKASLFKCVDCFKQAKDWSSETEEYLSIEEFKPRCRSCHVKKDKNWIKNK
jgi:hypothetical protein